MPWRFVHHRTSYVEHVWIVPWYPHTTQTTYTQYVVLDLNDDPRKSC